jgi:hypothetical protein
MSLIALNGVIMQSVVDLGFICPLGFEGRTFTPPQTGLWVYATILPVSSDQSLQTVDKFTRLLQLDCNDQMNTGTAGVTGLADQALSYYYPRRLFLLNGQSARAVKSDDSNIRIYGGYQSISVSIRFKAIVSRAFS